MGVWVMTEAMPEEEQVRGEQEYDRRPSWYSNNKSTCEPVAK